MDADDVLVAEIIHKIQIFVFPRRVRVRELFLDYDPLRSGRVTRAQFSRALNHAQIRLSPEDCQALSDHFHDTGPRVQPPQDICYDRFCEAVDEVFVTERLEKSPSPTVPSPGSTLQLTFVPQPVEDEEQVHHVLHRVAMLCKTRGVIIKYCFQDFERGPSPSPSNVNPRRAGKVTVTQFRRHFPFKKEFSEEEIDLMIQRYATEQGDIHFQALHNDVSQVLSTEMPPFPTSEFHPRADHSEWSHHYLDPVAKLQSKIVEKRIRMFEFFQDFDALRKGFCTIGQTKTVFTILGIDKESDRDSFDQLISRYTRDDGMFCYADFCADVDKAFTTPGLEREPTATITMPDATSTAPARRNRMTMTPARKYKVNDLEEKIRARVRVRRTLMKPTFQDMDRCHRGHVTRNQFARCMHMLGFELDETATALLASVYCDLGNHNEFNYLDFCKSCDPPDEEQETASQQINAPHQPFVAAKYFDARGKVHPLDRSVGVC